MKHIQIKLNQRKVTPGSVDFTQSDQEMDRTHSTAPGARPPQHSYSITLEIRQKT